MPRGGIACPRACASGARSGAEHAKPSSASHLPHLPHPPHLPHLPHPPPVCPQALRASQAEAEHLEAALAAAEEGAAPSVRALLSLERRLARMAKEAAASEARWRDAARGAARSAAVEVAALERRHAAELAAKDGLVERFRGQVDGLLAAARALQLVPKAAAPAAAGQGLGGGAWLPS